MKSTIKIIVIALLVGIGVPVLLAATNTWTAPTAQAPGDNVDAPLNVGDSGQYKLGGIALRGPFIGGSDSQFNQRLYIFGKALIGSSTYQLDTNAGLTLVGKIKIVDKEFPAQRNYVLASINDSGVAYWADPATLFNGNGNGNPNPGNGLGGPLLSYTALNPGGSNSVASAPSVPQVFSTTIPSGASYAILHADGGFYNGTDGDAPENAEVFVNLKNSTFSGYLRQGRANALTWNNQAFGSYRWQGNSTAYYVSVSVSGNNLTITVSCTTALQFHLSGSIMIY